MATLNSEFKAIAHFRTNVFFFIRDALPNFIGKSERDFAKALFEFSSTQADILPHGWYEPPPDGISVLTSHAADWTRLHFDSLRQEQYWPSDNRIQHDSVVIVYLSPVLKKSFLLADWGGTFYLGKDTAIVHHIEKCKEILYDLAKTIKSGMPFSEIHQKSQSRFEAEEVNNSSTLSTTDPSKTNLGHTVPFSFEYIFPENFSRESENYKDRISSARRFISAQEELAVPHNGAFTFEARLVDNAHRLPNTLVHLLIQVIDGNVEIIR